MAYFEAKKLPPITFPTLTGSIVTFNSQYAGLPLKSHTVEVVASQSGSGTPSPSNPRPISGWNGQNIYHSGADTSNPNIEYVAFGSTIYGGQRDARTGVLTVKYKYFSFDYTTPWANEISGGGNNFYYICPSDIKAGQYAGNSSMMCSASPISTILGAQTDHCFISNSRNFNFTWGDTLGITTAQGFKDYLQTNNIVIEVVAELATPQTIQLPPCPIDTLEVNNIWADTGDTTLQYTKFG